MPERQDKPTIKPDLPSEGSGGDFAGDIEIPRKSPSGEMQEFSFDHDGGKQQRPFPINRPPIRPDELRGDTHTDETAHDEPPEETLESILKPRVSTALTPGEASGPKARILNPKEILEEKIKRMKESELELEKALEKTQRLKEIAKDKRLQSIKSKLLPGFFILSLATVITSLVFMNYNAKKQAEELRRQEEAKKQSERAKKAKAAQGKKDEVKAPQAAPQKTPTPEQVPQSSKPEANPTPPAATQTEQPKPAEPERKADKAPPEPAKPLNAETFLANREKSSLESQIAEAKTQALDKMRTSDPEQVVIDFKDKLKSLGLSGAELASNVAPLAQLLPEPAFSQSCLEAMMKDPKYDDQARLYGLRHRLLYEGTPPKDSELKELPENADAHELLMICLIAGGKADDAMRVSISDEEFPSFWKTFISWRENGTEWQPNAQKLVWRESGAGNLGKSIAVRLWLGSIKYEDARNIVSTLPAQDAILLRIMLAEYSRKQGNNIAAQVLYTKVMNASPNLYKRLAERLRDN